jgi:ferric-dicitrate binding protein FerR (iron transport regulator)
METKFNTYSSIELAGEDRFVRWVLHGEHHHEWMQWAERHPANQQRIEEAKRLVLLLNSTKHETLSASSKSEMWNRIHTSIQKTPVKENKGKVFVLWKWGLAAAAALTLVIWFNQLTSKETIYAQAGEHKEFVLPEGSSVILNAGSVLSFKETSFSEKRQLYLNGEAFFKVKPGSTFTVHTDPGNVTVIGTSFNVFTRGERFEVSCYTGKVKVTADQQEQLISAGQRTIKNGNIIEAEPFSLTGETPGWANGKFIFDNQPLSEVFAELERQYDVHIDLEPGIDSLRYTGLFESGNLDEALELITWPRHLQVVKKGKSITISR